MRCNGVSPKVVQVMYAITIINRLTTQPMDSLGQLLTNPFVCLINCARSIVICHINTARCVGIAFGAANLNLSTNVLIRVARSPNDLWE